MDARSTRLRLVAVYTVVFSLLLKAFTTEHYPLFVLSGLATWVFFQSAVQDVVLEPLRAADTGQAGRVPAPNAPAGRRGHERHHARRDDDGRDHRQPDRDSGDAHNVLGGDPDAYPARAALERPGCCARLPHRRLSRCGAPYEHDLPSVVLPDAGLLHPGKPPGNRGSPVACRCHPLRELRDAVRRGDPRSDLLRATARPRRRRLLLCSGTVCPSCSASWSHGISTTTSQPRSR